MSQYLSRFYCGNKEGLCNFTEPIKYNNILDRQFDNLLVDVVSQCKGSDKEKGYCCYKDKESNKPLTNNDLENINKIAGSEIFKRNDKGDIFDGQVPLIKVNTNNNNETITSIDVCHCGGEYGDYKKCVNKNCKNFKKPTKYEYCKMGDMSNLVGCYGKNQKNCEAGNSNPESQYMYSHNLKIKNLFPDCYLNMCNKSTIDSELDNTASNNSDKNYSLYKNDKKSIYDKSIDNYLLIDKVDVQPSKKNNSIDKILFN